MDLSRSSSASRPPTPKPTTTPGQRLFENAHHFTVAQVVGRDVHHHYAHAGADPTLEDIAKIASWLSPINYWLYHNTTASLRTPKTGLWFLHGPEFQRWLGRRTGVLWVTGMPGAGKTVLSTNVVDLLRPAASDKVAPEDQPTALVFVYCRYMDHCTAGDILRAFLKQLLQSRRIVHRYLKPIFDEHAPKQTQLTELEAAETLQQLIPLFERTQAIIDGLDEVSDDEKVKFIGLLERLPMQVLIFSRPMDIYMELLPNIETLSIEAKNEDIELFARDRLQKVLTLRKLLHGKASLCEHITNTVKDKSRGMFLVATMQINSLKRSMNMRALTTALDTLPTGVDELYRLTMKRIDDQSEEGSRLALRTLLWLAYAHRTLTVEELQDALATSHETGEYDSESRTPIEIILSCCCGIVVVDRWTQEVRLIHYTALEYIRKLTIAPFSRRALIMASTCIAYLRHFRLFDYDVSSPSRLEGFLAKGPFLCYAYQFWGIHARELVMESDDFGVRPVALSFLRSCVELLIPFLHQATPLQYSKMALPNLLGYKMLDILSHQDRTFVSYDCLNSYHLTALYGLTPLLPIITHQRRPSRKHLWSALHLAALHGHIDMMKLLLSGDFSGLDVNAQDIHGRSALHLAAQGGNHSVVDLLASHPSIDVNRQDAFGCVPICVAAGNGHAVVVDCLLQCPSLDVNSVDNDENNLLLVALSYSRSIDPSPLAKHPIIDLNNNDGTPTHPTFRDCRETSDYMVKAITSHDKLQPNTTHKGDVTPLLFAVLNNRLNAVRSLLSHPGIDPNKCGSDGISPLMAASGCGSPAAFTFGIPEEEQGSVFLSMQALPHPGINAEVVQLLLSHPSTDVNLGFERGLSPLMLASVGGRAHLARVLLQDSRIDLSARSTLGRTALFWATADREAISDYLFEHPIIWPDILGIEESAARRARHTVAQQILLHPQLDPNLRCDEEEGHTALMLASRLGWGAIVRRLVLEDDQAIRHEDLFTSSSDLPSPSGGQYSPESPTENGINWSIVRTHFRCRGGLDINAVSKRCDTALTWACREGHMDIVDLMLSHPLIDVNAGSPLAAACSTYNNDNWEMVRLLIYDSTLRVNQRDPDGHTALIHACKNNRLATVELLLAHSDIDVNFSDLRGFTPLMAAVTSTAEDPTPLVALLRGCPDLDVNLQDDDGMTASHHTLLSDGPVFRRQFVLGSLLAKSTHGREVDISIQDHKGRSIRDMALDIFKLKGSIATSN